jgi:N-acetylglutamate synthase-like GNAT family acetyltransferase
MEIVNLKERKEHIQTLAVWHHQQWAYLHTNDSVERRAEELAAEFASDGIPKTFVAVEGDIVLGSASLILHDMDTRTDLTPWLASVFVAPKQRKEGIGSALVRQVVKQAKKQGVRKLYLFTPDKAVFYKRLGWSPFESVNYHGHPVEIMMIDPRGVVEA